MLQLLPVRKQRKRAAGLVQRHPHHRRQVGQDQDDVLRHLRPRHRTHAAEEGTHQHAAEADEDADLEAESGQVRGDEPHPVDLDHDVDKGHQRDRHDADQARQLAAVAGPQELGNGEEAESAQIRRQQQRHKTVAASPAQDVGQTGKALQIEHARRADEGRRRHPVRGSCHAIEDGRHAAAGDVVLRLVRRARHQADCRIDRHRGDQEGAADPTARPAHPLHRPQPEDEQEHPQRVDRITPEQHPREDPRLLGRPQPRINHGGSHLPSKPRAPAGPSARHGRR